MTRFESDGQRRRHLAELFADLREVAAHLADPAHGGTGNLRRLHAAQAGLRAGGGSGRPTGVSDPTGQAGTTNADPAGRDLGTLDQLLGRLGLDAAQAHRLLDQYGPARTANDADRLALARENRPPGPVCEHCATVKEPHGDRPFQCEADHRRDGPTDVAGRLPEKRRLCAWCVEFVARTGQLPTGRQLEAHRDGRRVLVADSTPTPRRTA